MKSQAQSSSRIRGMIKIGALTGVAVAAVAAALPAVAHHSFSAEFDGTKAIKATGSLTKLDWQNPHGWIHLTVTELCERTDNRGPNNPNAPEEEWKCRSPAGDEKGADWAFEIGSPNGLMRQGWTRNSLKPGDVVTVVGSRARDGSTNSNARTVTTADGKRLFAGSSQDATP
ncbi:MAG TPA: DUF6152 family protein [Gammaproteobacteria bacterium]|nr:DUF6152 family protein [Gammaproteobacteria bacterium]